MTPTATTTKTAPRILQVADRCDRCSAQARALIVMPSGLELQFCLHHTNRYAPNLPVGSEVFEQLGDLEG